MIKAGYIFYYRYQYALVVVVVSNRSSVGEVTKDMYSYMFD